MNWSYRRPRLRVRRSIVHRSCANTPISPITFDPVPPAAGAYIVIWFGTPLVNRKSIACTLVCDELRVIAQVSLKPTLNEWAPVTYDADVVTVLMFCVL